MMFLLDVNALLAMRYADHVHHGRVKAWVCQLESACGNDPVVFATCPITELGFIRVGSGASGYAASVDVARDDLQDVKSRQNMLFIPDDLHVRYLPVWVRKSAQTTDGYLLALAKSHGGQLATLDRYIPEALLIADESTGPLMVRNEAVQPDWAAQLPDRAADDAGSRGIAIR